MERQGEGRGSAEFFSVLRLLMPVVFLFLILSLCGCDTPPSDRVRAVDTVTLLATTTTATGLLDVLFQVVGAIAMILCFFILLLSFTANVQVHLLLAASMFSSSLLSFCPCPCCQDNSWEFGVLRAIGLSNVEVVLVYVFEALALTLAATMLGSGVGLLIATSLTLQFNLFSEMPFAFVFPTGLYASTVIMAVGCALVGSYLPARRCLAKSIADTIRGH